MHVKLKLIKKTFTVIVLILLIFALDLSVDFSIGNNIGDYKITKISLNKISPYTYLVNGDLVYFGCKNNITIMSLENESIIKIVNIPEDLVNKMGTINLMQFYNNNESILLGGTANNNETILIFSLFNYTIQKILNFRGIPIYINTNKDILFSVNYNENFIYYFSNNSLIKEFKTYYNITSINLSFPLFISSITYYENNTYIGFAGNSYINRMEFFEIKNFNIIKIKELNYYFNIYSTILNDNKSYLMLSAGYYFIPVELYVIKLPSFQIIHNFTVESCLGIDSNMVIMPEKNILVLPGANNITFISLNNFTILKVINYSPITLTGIGWAYYPFEYSNKTNSFYIFLFESNSTSITSIPYPYLVIISLISKENVTNMGNLYLISLIVILIAIIITIFYVKYIKNFKK